MSADQNLGTETLIYVRLLNEGTDVWRPARATPMAEGSFVVAKPDDYDTEEESWEFPPHARVRCARRRFADGEEALVAISMAE